jgi:hypothetical protein
MPVRPCDKAAEPITTAAAAEIKAILAEKLSATLVESSGPYGSAIETSSR